MILRVVLTDGTAHRDCGTTSNTARHSYSAPTREEITVLWIFGVLEDLQDVEFVIVVLNWSLVQGTAVNLATMFEHLKIWVSRMSEMLIDRHFAFHFEFFYLLFIFRLVYLLSSRFLLAHWPLILLRQRFILFLPLAVNRRIFCWRSLSLALPSRHAFRLFILSRFLIALRRLLLSHANDSFPPGDWLCSWLNLIFLYLFAPFGFTMRSFGFLLPFSLLLKRLLLGRLRLRTLFLLLKGFPPHLCSRFH